MFGEACSICDDELCEFIVTSHMKEVDRIRGQRGREGDAFPKKRLDANEFAKNIPALAKYWSYFKVMLIKRNDGFAYCIGKGTIYVDAWKSATPTWRQIGLA